MMSKSEGDPFILQKLLEKLEMENGGKENVKKDFLVTKNKEDGLSVIEY